MIKRAAKRKFKKITMFVVYAVAAAIFVSLVFFIFKNFNPQLNFLNSGSSSIVEPLGGGARLQEIGKLMSEKNVIYNKLYEASESGVIIAELNDGVVVQFSTTEDAKWQVTSLQLILARLTIDNKVTFIDLSSGKPIVKFNRL